MLPQLLLFGGCHPSVDVRVERFALRMAEDELEPWPKAARLASWMVMVMAGIAVTAGGFVGVD